MREKDRHVRLKPGQRLVVTSHPANLEESLTERQKRERIAAMTAATDYLHANYQQVEFLLGESDPMNADRLRMDTAPQLTHVATQLIDTGVGIEDVVQAVQTDLIGQAKNPDVRHLSDVARAYGKFMDSAMESVLADRAAVQRAKFNPTASS